MTHWWVNYPRSDRAEIDGSFLWLPKRNSSGSMNQSHRNMNRLMPGDVVFSCAAGTVAAIGIVLERARSAPLPGNGGEPAPSDDGWLVPVRFVELVDELLPKDHAAQIRPLLPPRQSPLRASGVANQQVHLAEIPVPLAQLLRRLLQRQVEDGEARIGMELDGRLAARAIEEQLWQRTDIGPRERWQLINARIGQGVFRERVELIETACRVTGILDRRYLRATHIKPWKDADDSEKLDGANGLLLSPHIHHLFDRGHISFADDGSLLISRHLNPYVRTAWGLERPTPAHPFTPEQCAHMDYHRQRIFEKIGGGRRSVADGSLEQDRSGR
jgi:putative restriction endonuclease